MDWKDAFGWWCTASSIIFIWPQVYRTLRHDTTQGIAPLGNAYAILSSNLWFFYSFWQEIPAGYWANVAFTSAQCLICYVLIRHEKMTWLFFFGFFEASVLIAVAANAISIELLGLSATVLSIGGMAPQFLHVLRTHDLHGLSVPSLTILVSSCVSWFLYGLFIAEFYYWLPQIILIPANTVILWKAYSWHRSKSDHQAAII